MVVMTHSICVLTSFPVPVHTLLSPPVTHSLSWRPVAVTLFVTPSPSLLVSRTVSRFVSLIPTHIIFVSSPVTVYTPCTWHSTHLPLSPTSPALASVFLLASWPLIISRLNSLIHLFFPFHCLLLHHLRLCTHLCHRHLSVPALIKNVSCHVSRHSWGTRL